MENQFPDLKEFKKRGIEPCPVTSFPLRRGGLASTGGSAVVKALD